MRRHPQSRPGVPRSSRRALATFVALGCALAGGVVRAAVIVGSDGKTTKVGVTPTPPLAPMMQAARKFGRHQDPAPNPINGPALAPKTPATPTPSNPVVTGTAEPPGEREFNSCRKFPAGKRVVKLNMKPDTELGDLIAWISSITCKQFLLPGTIPANSKKVTIIAPQLITPEEAYRLFLAALDSVGLTVEPSGKFLRIIETLRAKSTSIPVYGEDSDMPVGENYVTRLVRVENADVNEMTTVLTRIKGEQGDIVPYAPQNALIITDRAVNIDRMLRIMKEIDQPGGSGEKVWVVTVHNTAASDMAAKLGDIFQVQQLGGKRGATPPPAPGSPGAKPKANDLASELNISKIIPDERSNQLIVIATERAYARVLMLVKKLDVPIEGGDGRIHVYYCENANCDELAATLGAVTGVAVAGAAGGRTRTRGATPAAPTPTPAAAQGGGKENLLFEGEVRINFDRPTNSLIVVSSLKDYQSLRRVIERLDSPRKQVFVEAMILEVTIDKERDLGASWHAAKPENLFGLNDPSLIVGGLNPAKTIFPAASLSETMLAGVLGPVLSADQARSLGTASTTTVDIPSFGVLIKALQTNSDVDVLSNPHLLIMNNEEGEISVGQRIPFPVSTLGLGAAAGAAGAAGLGALGGLGVGGLFPQVQREKVALELKLTPHVNEHDLIRLEVDEKISEVAPGASNLGPSTSERTAKTIVVAKDQQTILIGGLMSDKVIDSVTKIPILGDIPVLGFFFRNTTKHVVKTNLIIALTPYVVNDQSDLRRVLEKKMKERREFVERFGGEDRHELDTVADYRRKRGMLEEINRAAHEVQEEEDEIQEIRNAQALDESGPLEPTPVPKPGAGQGDRRNDEGNVPAPAGGADRGSDQNPGPGAGPSNDNTNGKTSPPATPSPPAGGSRSLVATKRLGELLLEAKRAAGATRARGAEAGPPLTPELLEQALMAQQKEGGRIGEVLVKMRAVTEEEVLAALGKQLGIAVLEELKIGDVDLELASQVPIGFAKQHRVLVLQREGDTIVVATSDPLDIGALDDLRAQLGAAVQPVLVPSQKILEVINDAYGRTHDKGGDLGADGEEEDEGSSEELVDILEITDEAPIIRWVNSLLFNAVKERASDIHIEPGEKEVMVRYRIDGELYESRRAARQFMPSIISRVKIMAGLNIAEKRLPQDGRIRRKIAGKDIDMRVATVPTVKAGERITIRLLDRESVLHDLADIGFGDDHLRQMDDLIRRPHGILLVTGPTGSGKTTTLYACLAKINSPDLNILTIEDPVEYQLDGISQTAVNAKIELTFASGLRSFLRHDPDVIMVGEIRDRETSEIAIQASLTGHLVLSTIHTNDAAGAITRLVDLGVQPFLVASSLMALLAQRLVRRLCMTCRELYKPTDEDLQSINIDPAAFASGKARRVKFKGVDDVMPPGMLYRAKEGGCQACLGAGYKGRTAIYELLIIDEKIRQLTIKNADAQTVKNHAVSVGMRTLREDGAQKVLAGMTTTAEVLMITTQDSE